MEQLRHSNLSSENNVIGYAFVAASYADATLSIYDKNKTYTAAFADGQIAFAQTFATNIMALNWLQKFIDSNGHLNCYDVVKVQSNGMHFVNERNQSIKCYSWKVIDKWNAADYAKSNACADIKFLHIDEATNMLSLLSLYRRGCFETYSIQYGYFNGYYRPSSICESNNSVVQFSYHYEQLRHLNSLVGKFPCAFTYYYDSHGRKMQVIQQLSVNVAKPSTATMQYAYGQNGALITINSIKANKIATSIEYIRDSKGYISQVIETRYAKHDVNTTMLYAVKRNAFGTVKSFDVFIQSINKLATITVE